MSRKAVPGGGVAPVRGLVRRIDPRARAMRERIPELIRLSDTAGGWRGAARAVRELLVPRQRAEPLTESGLWERYDSTRAYDELVARDGSARPTAEALCNHLAGLSLQELRVRQSAAERTIDVMGITFTVYAEGENIDRAWPFDIVPRIVPSVAWQRLERGLEQRLSALNAFVTDVYGDRRIFRDGAVPRDLLAGSANFREPCVGARPPFDAWANICGTDLVRGGNGEFYVLEDNLRVPSGVSYMLENRMLTKRVLPELFVQQSISAIDDYPQRLYDTLVSLAGPTDGEPTVVLLTPGVYNSAYFEHTFLAQQMGIELVEAGDLVVEDDRVYMRTVSGLEQVDVIYRRIDDLFLDPETFRRDSLIGVSGLMRAWRAGNVAIANAPGVGVADDKVVYAYVPAMIKYYLAEEPIISNVETFVCSDDTQRQHVLRRLRELVVKPANESGGYGIVLGPNASESELAECADRIRADPRNYVAQPVVNLSTAPTLCETGIEPRHVDLRPFTLQGERTYTPPGGLTRVALRRGSFIVNSSQGGGSKDTWVVGAQT